MNAPVVLFENATLKLERLTGRSLPVAEGAHWRLTVKAPDGVAVITKAGMVHLSGVIAGERAMIVP